MKRVREAVGSLRDLGVLIECSRIKTKMLANENVPIVARLGTLVIIGGSHAKQAIHFVMDAIKKDI